MAISPGDFDSVLERLAKTHDFVSLAEAMSPSQHQRVAVTFDDGYADNLVTAAPILQARAIPASFFIATGFIDTQLLFPPDAMDGFFSSPAEATPSPWTQAIRSRGYWEALEGLAALKEPQYWAELNHLSRMVRGEMLEADPLRRPLTLPELRTLAAVKGFTLGPHTHSHRRMSAIDTEDALADIAHSVRWLQTRGLASTDFLAYPFGQKEDISPNLTAAIREQGFEPLTTLPVISSATTRRIFAPLGVARLSVGPAEIPLFSFLLRVLPLASRVPRAWLALLALRRRLTTPRTRH